MVYLRALLGVGVFCVLAWLMSENRRKIPWRVIFGGIALQLILGWFVLKTETGGMVFHNASDLVLKVMGMTRGGAELVFGSTIANSDKNPGVVGMSLGFMATGLPAIIFLSALMAILYHFGVMQSIVWVLARLMSFFMGVSGAESLCMATNIFMGQTEAPLTIRPYMPRLTRSELNSVMTGGFATMAAGMIGVYTSTLAHDNFYGPHLLAAEVMSAPAAFVICKLIRPETETPESFGKMPFKIDRTAHNVFEAAATGTRDGMHLWLNVIAMLISFSALLALLNWMIGSMHAGWSLQAAFGYMLAPVAWCVGIDNWHDCRLVGSVMGTKIASNEFIGFLQLKELLPDIPTATAASMPAWVGEKLSQRSAILSTYSICDFANFVSIGIQIGGMTPLAENRKADFARLALRAMLGGCLASYMTAAIAGMFV